MVIIYVFKINYVNMYLGERSYYKWKGRGKVNSSMKRIYGLEEKNTKQEGRIFKTSLIELHSTQYWQIRNKIK